MRLPLLQKIEIETKDIDEICLILKRNNVSSCPTVLVFDHLKDIPMREAVKACQKAFEVSELNPLLPYPTYIVTQMGIEQRYFPEIKDTTSGPKHFRKKIKKVKKREATLLSKATTYSERIHNHNLVEDLSYLSRKARDNKALKKLCCEKSFYLNLLEDLKNPSQSGGENNE